VKGKSIKFKGGSTSGGSHTYIHRLISIAFLLDLHYLAGSLVLYFSLIKGN
jgi:hypothetical protein